MEVNLNDICTCPDRSKNSAMGIRSYPKISPKKKIAHGKEKTEKKQNAVTLFEKNNSFAH